MAITADKIARLKSQLLSSGIQSKDNPLWQVINQLIDAVADSLTVATAASSGGGGGGGSTTIVTTNLISPFSGELDELQESLVPGPPGINGINGAQGAPGGIVVFINDAVDGEDGFGVPGVAGRDGVGTYYEWSVLTNGDPVTPEIIFAGGDVVMIRVP